MEMKFQLNGATMELIHRYAALKSDSDVDNGIAEDKGTAVECDPWYPPYPPYDSSTHKSYLEWCKKRNALLKISRASNIIIPDRTPQDVNSAFYKMYPSLLPILKKDSVRCFLRLYVKHKDCITWGFIIIPEAFNRMIIEDALQCAEVVLEGKAPELEGVRANPNCMNKYGYFPLHEAAERFSVDMIKLLLKHGTLTNLRTAGTSVIEGLLPLHVAVENTCLHKYLEENLLPNQMEPNYPTKKDDNYVYNIIYLLCLPKMKIFLDTTRLLAEHTDNLVGEIWNYIKDRKLLQTAVLLLSAQGHIRAGCCHRRNGNGVVDGFITMLYRLIMEEINTVKLGMGRDEKEKLNLEAQGEHLSATLLLVQIILKAGEALDSYIQTHEEVPETDVLRRVTQILNDNGFFPTEAAICVANLWPYDWLPEPDGELPEEHGKIVETEAAAETPNLYPADKMAARVKFWRRRATWNQYFPYWRSVLASRFPVKVYPSHAQADVFRLPKFDLIQNSGSKSFGKRSMPAANGNTRSLARRIPRASSMNQSSRLFGTVALAMLKVLRNA